MMGLFKKDKNKPLTAGQDAVAQRIAERIISRHKRTADYLNAKTQDIPRRLWLWLLIAFSLIFGGYCLYLVIGAWL
jgi:hypothetical protein